MFLRLIIVYSAILLVVLFVFAFRVAQGVRRHVGKARTEVRIFGPRATCPICGSKIGWPQSSTCPRCSNTIQPRRSYSVTMFGVTVVLSGLIASVVGATGDAWLWTTILG